ncbi:hypothetical protein Q6346_15235 [Isoptericola sp. b490]|nr:hypothetical protein [Isoptericola sp. b490]
MRLVDDRTVPAGRVRCVQVAGQAGVAPEAAAVFVNVTTVRPDGPGYVVVYPDTRGDGATPAPGTSTVNFEPGADVANAAVVALPADGRLCYLTRGAARTGVLIDVTGYTRGAADVHAGSPIRLLDTRTGADHVGPINGPVRPGHEYTVDVLGHAGVPAQAVAVLANVTVTGVAAVGNLVVYPAGEGKPGTSTLNYAVGKDKASATVVGLSVAGRLSLYSTSSEPVQVIIDITGWIGADSPLVPVPPTRVMDTRRHPAGDPAAGLHAAERRTLDVLEAAGGRVPQDAAGVLLTVTAVHPSALGNLRVYPGGGTAAVPYASTLNYIVGRDVPNTAVVGLDQAGAVTFYDDQAPGGTVDLVVDLVGYVAARTDIAVLLDPTVTPQTCDHGLLLGGSITWPDPLPTGIVSAQMVGWRDSVDPQRDLDPRQYSLEVQVADGYALVDPGAIDEGGGLYHLRPEVPAYSAPCVPETHRVTIGVDGAQPDGAPGSATVSDGAHWVAYDSAASNLVADKDPDRYWTDSFVTDRLTGETERVSDSPPGQPDGYVAFRRPSISADGRYVAFGAYTAEDIRCQIYLRDRGTGLTTMISTGPDGAPGNHGSRSAVVSADGRWVVYSSAATDLVPGLAPGSWPRLYAYDRTTGATSFVADGWNPSVSGDGRWIAHLVDARDLVPDARSTAHQVAVTDRVTGATTLISATADGSPLQAGADHPAISADGRWVAFDSFATDIPEAPWDASPDRSQVYLADRLTGATVLVSRDRFASTPLPGSSLAPSVSADGRWVAFTTFAADLFGHDENGTSDVVVWDRVSQRSVPLSVGPDGMTADGASGSPAISPDGRWVAYRSDASNLVAGDTVGSADIFLTANPWARDLAGLADVAVTDASVVQAGA